METRLIHPLAGQRISLTVQVLGVSGTTVYAGGTFATLGAVTRNGLAAIDLPTGTITSWTVPSTGTYSIEAWGAQGGTGDSTHVGGKGARMKGDFALTAGTVLKKLGISPENVAKTAQSLLKRRKR